jgi:hypothetical protein
MRSSQIIFLTGFLFSFTVLYQEYESALIPTEKGAVLAFTSDNKSFSIELISENVEPLEQRNLVKIDDWILQAFIIGFDNPKNVDLSTEEEQKKSLSQYVMYEINYFKEELGFKCDSLELKWGQLNNNYFYFWHFNTPDSLETLHKQIFLTTICHDQFLNMNIPLEKTKNFKDAKDLLFTIGRTLKIEAQQLSPNDAE